MFSKRNLKRNFGKLIKQPLYGFKVLVKRIKADMYYKEPSGTAPYPEAVTFFLTYKCNLKCKMCGQWGDSGVTKHKDIKTAELPVAVVKNTISEIKKYKPNITLFGGEPLLHKDIKEIIKIIKDSKLHCLVITNGFLLYEYADTIIEYGLDEINLSIDGCGELHDRVRGIEGLYERIKKGIDLIVEKRNGKKPLINLQVTINPDNYDRLESIVKAAEELHADSITFHHLIFQTEDNINETGKRFGELGVEDWNGFKYLPGIDPEILAEQINVINNNKKRKPSINFYPNLQKDELIKYYSNPNWFPSSYKGKCKSSWICAYIFPDGKVRPCLNFSYDFGNLEESGFNGIWNSSKAKEFRRKLQDCGRFPVCNKCTEIFRY